MGEVVESPDGGGRLPTESSELEAPVLESVSPDSGDSVQPEEPSPPRAESDAAAENRRLTLIGIWISIAGLVLGIIGLIVGCQRTW